MSKLVGTVLAVTSLLTVSVWPAGSAQASNWYGATNYAGCNNGNMQDNRTVSYKRQSLTSTNYNAVAHAINNEFAPTDLNFSSEQSSYNSYTDMVFFDANYSTYCGYTWYNGGGGGVIGLAECKSTSGSKCQSFHIRFDTQRTDSYNNLTLERRLACHETGHATGLKHRSWNSSSCMASSYTTPYSSADGHDDAHLNSAY
jgi:hypothetical protein